MFVFVHLKSHLFTLEGMFKTERLKFKCLHSKYKNDLETLVLVIKWIL